MCEEFTCSQLVATMLSDKNHPLVGININNVRHACFTVNNQGVMVLN